MNFFARNEVHADIGHVRKVRLTHADLAFVAAITLGFFALGTQCVTQWLASRLAYQPALGTPLYDGRPLFVPFYAPWESLRWVDRLRGSARASELVLGWSTGLERAGIAAVFAAVIALINRYRFRRNRVLELHGSARWAERDDIQHTGLFAKDGVVLGTWEDRAARTLRILRTVTPDHILLFACTGSGKGVGCVLPTLLTCTTSALVLDLKGENFALTSGYRAQELGQNVFKLDFGAEPGATARFNFLDFVRFGTAQEEADIQRIASARVDPTGALRRGHTDGSHWLKTGIGLLAAAILHTVYKRGVPAAGACPISLTDVALELSNPARTQEAMLKEWLTFPHDPSQRWIDHLGRPTHTHPIVSAVARVQLERSEGERSSVMSTVVTALEVFRDPLLQQNTSVSDFASCDLMDDERPTTLYLVARPPDLDRLAPVINLFLDLTLRRLVEKMEFEAGEERGTHKHPLLLVLDELPALGKVNIIAEALGYFRGWGIRALVVVQSLMQLKEFYGQFESISGLCGVAAAYAPAPTDIETAKTISAMVGTTTVIRRTPDTHRFGSGNRSGATEQEVSRPLMTPDEVRTMPGPKREGKRVVEAGEMLVFPTGCPAIRARQMLFFQDPELLRRSQIPPAPVVPDDRLDLRPSQELAEAPAPYMPRSSLSQETPPADDDIESADDDFDEPY